MSGLRAVVRVPARGVDLDLDLPAGDTLALLGPNGAGKSTLLLAVAGLLRPASGLVRVGGDTWLDTDAGVDLPAHRRRAALLLQRPTLFAHLSVRDNVAFGPRTAGRPAAEAAAVAGDWLERVGCAHLADRRPHQLSGGQAARVAIARALAADPPVVLLDEPLAALDVVGAAQVRAVLAEVLIGRTSVLVTHSGLDVAALADRVAVVEDGRVTEAASAARFLAGPRTQFGRALLPG